MACRSATSALLIAILSTTLGCGPRREPLPPPDLPLTRTPNANFRALVPPEEKGLSFVSARAQLFARTLTNGMRVEVLRRPESTVAAIVVVFRGAGAATQAEPEGVAPLAAALLLEGTRIADGSVLGGLTINGHTPNVRTFPDGSVLKLETVSSLVPHSIDLLSQIVQNPAFEPVAFGQALNRQLNAIARGSMTLHQHLLEAALEELHGSDPAVRSDLGRSGPVLRLTNDDVRRFYARRYRPESSALIVVGDADPEMVFALAESRFGGWRAQLEIPLEHTPRPLPRNASRQIALAVSILAGHASSRAFEALRLHNGQAYAVGAEIEQQARASHMQLFLGVAHSEIVSATSALFRERERLANTLPSEAELNRAKMHAHSSWSFRLGGNSGFADERAREFLTEPPNTARPPLRDRIERATAEDVKRAAANWLRRDRLQLAIVANRSVAEAPLRELGKVRWFTLESNAKDPEHF